MSVSLRPQQDPSPASPSYEVLDAARDQAFEDLTLLATHICDVPMALVSLVDERRHWFKSRVRVADNWTPRDISLGMDDMLATGEIFEVRDAEADPRFARNPVVTSGPRIRFYAGAPLVTPEGRALGAVCVMDRAPRMLTDAQRAALKALARRVVAQLELRRKTSELAKAVAEHEQVGLELRKNLARLAAAEQKTQRLLETGEKSRRGLLSVLEDEKRTAQNLRESEERFRQMTESIDEVFWMADPVHGSLIYMSPAYEKVWGRPSAGLLQAPHTWVEAVHPEDRARILEATRTKQMQGEYNETYRIIRPDGAVRWLHEQAFPVRNPAGEIYRMVGVAQDITEKKELETQFYRAQRLESIGTLASGIAHDLNNILAPIMMAAPLIRESTSPALIEKMLVTIEMSTTRAAKLVRQLLTFGRGIEGEKDRLSIEPLIAEMLAMAQQTFPKNITVTASVPDNLAPVMADGTQVHQVLLNLCVNARDAMPHGGTLAMSADNARLDAAAAASIPGARPGNYVWIQVTDTGTGMTPELMDKIFDPFFTTKEMGKGTGLGLATVLGLIKSHDGFLTLTSEVGRGSTFRAYLPAASRSDSSADAEPNSAAMPPRGNGELLLVVDDEENIRDALRGILTQHGYAVVVAEDGIEGTSRYAMAQDEIKLVIMDLDMPNMNGMTMGRIFRMMNPAVKIIASSGISSGKQNDLRTTELKSLGVTAIIDKPYTAAEILRAVYEALSTHATTHG